MNLSFAGCGFLGIYHVGVAVCFKKYAPHLLLHKISGASAGALAACCLLCDMPLAPGYHRISGQSPIRRGLILGEMTSDFFRVVNEARKHSLGPFSPKFNIQTSLLEGLQKFLPVDAHLRVNGRLHISLTRVYDGKSVIVSQFNSREDLLQALLCACFIPVFSGLLPPRFHGVRYMDGAFSDNLPILDENTVTVSPFSGESDICPRDQSTQLFHVNWANTSIEVSKQNINRFGRILFPPKPEVLSNMCQQGFDDALRFLHRNNLISCTRCLSVQSTFIVSEATVPEVQEYDPECKECTEHRKEAKNGNMPDTVLTVFQTYIDSANKGLANWIFRHRSAKLIHALSLPATLPADFVCATLTNLVGDTVEKRDYQFKVIANALHARNSHCSVHGKKSTLDYRHYEKEIRRLLMAAPSLGNQIWHVSKYVLSQLNSALIPRKQKQKLAADLSYQLALTEYGEKLPYTNNNTNNCTDNHKIDIIMDDSPISGTELVPAKCKNINQPNSSGEDDTFEHILQVTSHQEAVYAYYYLDENNKVKVTEIFDMTENDNPSLQTANERETNQQLQFDTDWDVEQPDFMFDGMSDPYYDNIIDNYHNTTIEYDDDEDFTFDLYNTSKNCKDTKMITNYEHQKLTIEDITHHDDDENYLQPEVDQTTNLFSESISNLLTKPIPHTTISFD